MKRFRRVFRTGIILWCIFAVTATIVTSGFLLFHFSGLLVSSVLAALAFSLPVGYLSWLFGKLILMDLDEALQVWEFARGL